MIIALTGHRSEDCESEDIVRASVRRALQAAPGVEAVISGMANGLDLWGADEAIGLGLPVWAARPWGTHGPRTSDTELYAKVLREAERVIVVTDTDEYPGPWVYHKRNEWMVDHATHVLAYWSGKKRGGTYACLQYASKKLPEDRIKNCYGKL